MGMKSDEPVQWIEALALMRTALDLLDSANAPAEVGAHLDLAIVRFEAILSTSAIEHHMHEIAKLPPSDQAH